MNGVAPAEIVGVRDDRFPQSGQHQRASLVPRVTVLVVVYLVTNLAVDLLYFTVDPRLRVEGRAH